MPVSGAEGRRYTKREFIDDAKANPLGFVSNEVNDVLVRFFGDVAIAQRGRDVYDEEWQSRAVCVDGWSAGLTTHFLARCAS